MGVICYIAIIAGQAADNRSSEILSPLFVVVNSLIQLLQCSLQLFLLQIKHSGDLYG